jgi:uncharacterized DUF497 family protein
MRNRNSELPIVWIIFQNSLRLKSARRMEKDEMKVYECVCI